MTNRLITIGASHYCEKARWALDHLGVDYQLRHLPPGAHLEITKELGAAGSSLPLLVRGAEFVQGSGAIIDWAETVRNAELFRGRSESEREASRVLEERLDDAVGKMPTGLQDLRHDVLARLGLRDEPGQPHGRARPDAALAVQDQGPGIVAGKAVPVVESSGSAIRCSPDEPPAGGDPELPGAGDQEIGHVASPIVLADLPGKNDSPIRLDSVLRAQLVETAPGPGPHPTGMVLDEAQHRGGLLRSRGPAGSERGEEPLVLLRIESMLPVHFKSQVVQIELLSLGFTKHPKDGNRGRKLETATGIFMFFGQHEKPLDQMSVYACAANNYNVWSHCPLAILGLVLSIDWNFNMGDIAPGVFCMILYEADFFCSLFHRDGR